MTLFHISDSLLKKPQFNMNMKKILIFEEEQPGAYSIKQVCESWPDDLQLFYANNENSGFSILTEKYIDLLIVNLSSGYGPQIENLANLTYKYPCIPCIAVINRTQQIEESAVQKGATLCVEAPVRSAEFRLQVHKTFDLAVSGKLSGIAVHSLLQMFETEEKTCSLSIECSEKKGLIFMKGGTLIGSESDDLIGEEALYRILTWEDATIHIKYYNGQRSKEIHKPLMSLIMEAYRLKDEKENLEENSPTEQKIVEIKNLLPSENQISLDVGTKIHMEIVDIETPLLSTLIGLAQNQYLIVNTPKPYGLIDSALQKNEEINIKYLHKGRICTFTTRIIQSIDSPHKLLFLQYPPVVHFHELRRAQRTPTYVPCSFMYNGTSEITGVLVDLSSVGCLFMSKKPAAFRNSSIDIDANVQLNCYLPGIEGNQQISGRVMNMSKSSTELKIGIDFYGLPPYLEKAIASYVKTVESSGH